MIYCVEDDADIREIEVYALKGAGFEVLAFEKGKDLFEALKKEKPKLILLDIMLEEMNGLEILKSLKSSFEYRDIPVILASAKGQEYDRIIGLDLGADDYIVKPFSVLEMVSRVKAVLRRSEKGQDEKLLKYKDLSLNKIEHSVLLRGKKLALTHKEFELLALFLKHPRRVYTREQLFSLIWHEEYMGDSRTLDTHIRSLRFKLEDYGTFVETIRNVGYVWGNQDDK